MLSALIIASAGLYIFVLYYLLFALVGREMVIMSVHMLGNYNYWNSINLRASAVSILSVPAKAR